MINMIKADFYRIVRSKGIYIAFVIILIMLGLDIYMVEAGSVGMHIESPGNTESGLDEMSYEQIQDLSFSDYRQIRLETKNSKLDREILANNLNLYYAFIFAAALGIAVDFSGSCVKNTLSSAISRKKYFLSKLVFVTLCCLIMFFFNTYAAYFANIVFNNRNLASDIGTVTKISLMQLPPMLAIISILTGFAFAFKKTAAFNTISIPFIMLFQILLNLMGTFFKIPAEVFEYELQIMIIRLAMEPSTRYILQSYAVCAAIIIVFTLIGWLSFKKAEIR